MSQNTNTNMVALGIAIQTGWYGGKNIPVGLEGAPGTAKTQIIEQISDMCREYLKENGIMDTFAFENFTGPQTSPESLEGICLPDLENRVLDRAPLRRLRNLVDADGGIFVVDELSSTLAATGAAAMTGFQDGIFGDIRMSDKVAKVGLWNPPDCAAAGREFSLPEINRFMVLDWVLPFKDWADYRRGGKGVVAHFKFLPPDWESPENVRGPNEMVLAFLDRFPHLVNAVESGSIQTDDEGRPWPSLRAWENVIRLLAAAQSIGEGVTSDLALTLTSGMVGKAAGRQFIQWASELDLPDPEEFLDVCLQYDGTPQDFHMVMSAFLSPTIFNRRDKLQIALDSLVHVAAEKDHSNFVERWKAAWLPLYSTFSESKDIAYLASKKLFFSGKNGNFSWAKKNMDPEIARMFGDTLRQTNDLEKVAKEDEIDDGMDAAREAAMRALRAQDGTDKE